MSDRSIGLDIFRTALPMKSFEHAAATRKVAEAIVVRLRTAEGKVGWGEALPRDYVTGETLDSVPRDIESNFWPRLRDCRNTDEVLAAVAALPCRDGDRVVTAARCAVELAALQAFGLTWQSGQQTCDDQPPAERLSRVRVTGVIGSSSPGKTARKLRLMRWYGLRSFKLKLGLGEELDRKNLRAVLKQLARGLAKGECSLRVDVNGAWKYKDVAPRVAELKAMGVLAVEQPCTVKPSQLVDLAMTCELPLIADESCLTEADADVLLGAEGHIWLNLRLAKNGGFGPTLAMARKAAKEEAPYILGCMVGESGILSTAQRIFLASAPPPTMLEGNYGRFLLRDDLVRPSPRFGYGGRLMLPSTWKFDPAVRGDKVRRYGTLVRTLG
jgi:L-Ala-D/L-Glu epimerase